MEFQMVTTDNEFTHTDTTGAAIVFEPVNNNIEGVTQGFQHKVQKGRMRMDARVQILVNLTTYENTILPMLEHPTAVNCTFDRTIPTRNSATGQYNFVDVSQVQELPSGEYDIELILKEIIEG